jgi:DNA-binding phage protein
MNSSAVDGQPWRPCKALSGERSLDFSTLLKVLRALGIRLDPEAA